MYFPNDRLRKTWLHKSLKHAASEDPSTVKVCTATTLSYLSIPVSYQLSWLKSLLVISKP